MQRRESMLSLFREISGFQRPFLHFRTNPLPLRLLTLFPVCLQSPSITLTSVSILLVLPFKKRQLSASTSQSLLWPWGSTLCYPLRSLNPHYFLTQSMFKSVSTWLSFPLGFIIFTFNFSYHWYFKHMYLFSLLYKKVIILKS